jgi:hypothetical protein
VCIWRNCAAVDVQDAVLVAIVCFAFFGTLLMSHVHLLPSLVLLSLYFATIEVNLSTLRNLIVSQNQAELLGDGADIHLRLLQVGFINKSTWARYALHPDVAYMRACHPYAIPSPGCHSLYWPNSTCMCRFAQSSISHTKTTFIHLLASC